MALSWCQCELPYVQMECSAYSFCNWTDFDYRSAASPHLVVLAQCTHLLLGSDCLYLTKVANSMCFPKRSAFVLGLESCYDAPVLQNAADDLVNRLFPDYHSYLGCFKARNIECDQEYGVLWAPECPECLKILPCSWSTCQCHIAVKYGRSHASVLQERTLGGRSTVGEAWKNPVTSQQCDEALWSCNVVVPRRSCYLD